MTLSEQLITIFLCGFATVITRFLPFVLFSRKGGSPKWVVYLGKVLPLSVFALLIVYCFKDVSFAEYSYGLPELIGVGVTVAMHLWRKNMLLSIASGTIVYMVLVQTVFI